MNLKITIVIFVFFMMFAPLVTLAENIDSNNINDSDRDGLVNKNELKYGVNPNNPDTDGYFDGDEISHGYNPLISNNARVPKRIDVNLSEQRLRYYHGEFGEQGIFF